MNEILKLSKKDKWGHVPGVQNPADLGSRGVTASHLRDSKLWWEGPEWLKEEKEKWPQELELDNSSEVASERKRMNVLIAVTKEIGGVSNMININRFGNLGKLLRVKAYVRRFVGNLKAKLELKGLNVERLSADEIESAEKL